MEKLAEMRKSIILNTLFCILLVSLAVGCSRVEIPDQGINHDRVSFIVESVSSSSGIETRSTNLTEEPLVDSLYLLLTEEDWPVQADVVTKGTVITTDSFQTTYSADGFGVYAEKSGDASTVLFNNAVFTYNNSSSLWLPSTNVYWPDYKTDFYAWAPKGAASLSSSSKSFSYTVPAANADQKDLLVAKTSVEASNESAVSLVFTHALAAVRFAVGTTMTEGKITSLKISGLNTSGTYNMAAGTWGSLSTKKDLTLTTEVDMTADTPAGTAITGESETFFVIPQVCSDGASVQIVFDGETKTIPLPAAYEFKAGKIYTLKVSADPHTYEYSFDLLNEADSKKTYLNTTEAINDVIKLSSFRTVDAADKEDVTWVIKSVKVGSGSSVDVNDVSFEGLGGLDATIDGTELKIAVSERTNGKLYRTNEYWTNKNGQSGDNTGDGWSPKSWADKGAIDLSKLDFEKDQINAHSMTTANCYVIRHAGTYKIPLVYGNGVVGGTTNTESYKPTMASGGLDKKYFLSTFKNHQDKDISDPFIENNSTGTSGQYITANSAAVIWQDMAEVVKDVKIISGEGTGGTGGSYTKDNVRYLQFTIKQEDICQNNAVIAIKDSDGNVIWSWHIWTTNNPAILSGPIPVDSYYKEGYKYDFFPVYNIGWIDNLRYDAREQVKIVLSQNKSDKTVEITVNQPEIAAQSCGTWFQYGRKDPMLRTESPAVGTFSVAGGPTTLQNGILNPAVFYPQESDSKCNWCSTDYLNLWTGKYNNYGTPMDQDNDKLIKTIYDPSPVGYKVPASYAFSVFTSIGDEVVLTDDPTKIGTKPYYYSFAEGFPKFNIKESSAEEYALGWSFYTCKAEKVASSTPTIYFAASSYRSRKDGTTAFWNENGLYWAADSKSTKAGYYFGFCKTDVRPFISGQKSNAMSVRPVKEK